MRRSAAVALALLACGTHDEPRQRVATEPAASTMKLARWRMQLPEGWTATYEVDADKWLFTAPPLPDGRTATARFERAPRQAVASPEAYLHYKRTKEWDRGTTAELEKREAIRDGFAVTASVKAAADPDHPKRETYVVREIGNEWFQCVSEWIVDDKMRDDLVGLCKSVKP